MKAIKGYHVARLFLLLMLVGQGRLGIRAEHFTAPTQAVLDAVSQVHSGPIAASATVDLPSNNDIPLILAFTCIMEVEEEDLRSVTSPVLAELPFHYADPLTGEGAMARFCINGEAMPAIDRHLLLQVFRV